MKRIFHISIFMVILSAQFILVNPTAAGSVDDSLAASYSFDEGSGATAKDASGNNYHGTVSGASWTAGKIGGGALSFNGAGDYVSIPRMNYDEITVSAWFYRNSADPASADAILGGWRWNSDTQLQEGIELRFPINSNILQFTAVTRNSTGTKTQKTASKDLVISTGSWYHAVGTYNKTSGEQKLYVNGLLANTQTHPLGNTIVPLTNSTYPDMRIGHSRINNGYFNGKIDDVRIYYQALNEEVIVDLYNLVNANTAPTIESFSAIGITKDSAILNAKVNPNYLDTAVWFEYGRDKGSLTYKSLTKQATGYRDAFISIPIYSLSDNTTYYYRAAAMNSSGTNYGQTNSFLVGEKGDDGWKNWYAITWRDTVANQTKYAKQMGYEYVGIQPDPWNRSPDVYHKDPNSRGLRFYLINPNGDSYSLFNGNGKTMDQNIDTTKTYSQADMDWYNQRMAWGKNASFPDNLAQGWFNGGDNGSAVPTNWHVIWDVQQQAVIDEMVGKIIATFKAYSKDDIDFKPAGYMMDVPSIYGEYCYWPDYSVTKGRCAYTTISHWTGTDSCLEHDGITHEYSTYQDGVAAFHKQLNKRMREAFPGTKWINEPYYIYRESGALYDDSIYLIKSRNDKVELTADMYSMEGSGVEFVDDQRNFNSGMNITRDMVGITQPNRVGEYENRLYAAKAGINGAWYNWFGRFGGTGDMPGFQSITEVYPRLKLIRLIPNWDNLNRVLLTDRSWNGSVYQSPKSYIDANLMYSRQPKTGKLFAVFNTHNGALRINSDETITSINKIDGYFMEAGDASDDFDVSGSEMRLKETVVIPEASYTYVKNVNGTYQDFTSTVGTGIGYIFTVATSSAPIVSTESAENAISAATLKAGVSPNGSDTAWWFEYGTDAKILLTKTKEQSIAAASGSSSVSAAVAGLKAATTYYYRIRARNKGGTSCGATLSFTTLAKVSGSEAYYAFDEGSGFTAIDLSGSGNNGSIEGPSWTTSGKIGKALSFDGSNDYVDFSTNLGITGELTVSAWVYPKAAPNGSGRIIASTYDWDSVASAVRGWTLGCEFGSADQIAFRVYDSSGNSARAATATTSAFFSNNLNKWVYVTGVYKPFNYIKLYINDQKVAETTSGVPAAIAYKDGTYLRLGMRADGAQGMWDGNIDEVRIYSQALTDAQVQVLYTATGNLAPVITSVLKATGTAATALSYQITADNNPTSFSAAGLPAGLSVSTATGLISGTPGTIGTSSVTISAANASGTGADTLTLSVYSACDVNRDEASNVADVQLQINQALGAAACASDLNRDGSCNVIDVQRVVNAGLGGQCVLGP